MELLTPTEMAEADRRAIDGGTPGMTLMEAAGAAVATTVQSICNRGGRVVVAAGPGNNGGDGYVAARLLAERGYAVRVLLLGEAARLKGNAALAARTWRGTSEPPDPDAFASADVIVDALFGAGLDRPVEGPARMLIAAMNAACAPIVAVDLPSGINGASGAVMGAAVMAARTVTFFRRKPGHVLLPGRMHCGQVSVADIGIPASVLGPIAPRCWLNEPALWAPDFPVPQLQSHKYARGHAVVVSGEISSTGAARLAARGALRAGAGLVTIASPVEALAVNAAANLAVMVWPVAGAKELAEFLQDTRRNCVVLGPGGGVGKPMKDKVLAALSGARAVVLDADALTSFADEPKPLFAAIKGRTGSTVLTPHEGEFRRLFKGLKNTIHAKLERAGEAAATSGAVVLIKGADTVVAAPDGRAAIAANAPAWLATAGSGDVLAGFIAGLLAQGMSGFEAACTAVWLHGETGNEAGPGLIAEDLPEALPAVYRRLLGDAGFDRTSADRRH
ncbi:MAG: NAD(P)H-hydrate dehydratase [Xanthobacteraceae bacterium]